MQRELDVAAALLFEERPPPTLLGVEEARLVSLLRANRVPVAILPRWHELVSITPPGPLISYAALQLDRLEESREAYADVAAAWAENGIDGVLIKSAGYFPYTSSNVDVLVARSRAHDAFRILLALGYAELELAREPYKRLFRKLDAPNLGFPLHLHTAVGWINKFLDGSEVISAARPSEFEPLLYPSSDHVVLVTTAHSLYEDKELTLRDLHHVARAIFDGVNWRAVRARSEQGGWLDGLELALGMYDIAARRVGARTLAEELPQPSSRRIARRALASAAGDGIPPYRVSRVIAKALQVAKSLRNRELALPQRIMEGAAVLYFAGHAKLPSIRRGASLVVAVSGPDGAGKTTIARTLAEKLESEAGVSAGYRWRRLGSSRALGGVRGLVAWAVRKRHGFNTLAVAQHAPLKNELEGRPRIRRAWAIGLGSEFVARAWIDHARARAFGGIQIFDRGAIDAAADIRQMYLETGDWILALAPRPGLQLLVLPESQEEDFYRGFERDADLVLRARDPIDRLVDAAMREVVRAYIDASRTR